jgi:uncharacterized protein
MAKDLTASDVLRRYMHELPEFAGVDLVDVNQRGNFGNPPLKAAAVRGSLEELVALLDAGADVDARGEHGYTPLHHAVSQGHLEAVKLLLERGASRTALTDDGWTLTELADDGNREEIAALLLQPDRPD